MRAAGVLATAAVNALALAGMAVLFARHGAHVYLTHRWGSADEDALQAEFNEWAKTNRLKGETVFADSFEGTTCSLRNAIESVNMSLRKLTKNRGSFPSDEALLKLFYLALRNISQKWTMPIPKWKDALNHFAILFEDRLPQHLN